MALTPWQMALTVSLLGTVSFIFGVIAEAKKPKEGEAIAGRGVVICKYPHDPSVVYGFLSFAFLVLSTFLGYYALFYPYNDKSIPQSAFFTNRWFNSIFCVALATTGLAATFILCPTITEHLHHINNIHSDQSYDCPTAKTGLLGGGAFVSLCSTLFWLLCLMLVNNVREDHFQESLLM